MSAELELLIVSTALCVVTVVLIAVWLRQQARTLEEKRRSDSRYRIVVDQAGDGVFLVDAQTGRLTEANLSFRRRLGYGSDEIVQLKVEDILVEMPISLDTAAFDRLTNTRSSPPHDQAALRERTAARCRGDGESSLDRQAADALLQTSSWNYCATSAVRVVVAKPSRLIDWQSSHASEQVRVSNEARHTVSAMEEMPDQIVGGFTAALRLNDGNWRVVRPLSHGVESWQYLPRLASIALLQRSSRLPFDARR